MKALVTGGVGFLGSHLVERLLTDGWAVDVVDDLSSGSMVNLADARADRSHELTIHRLDVRDPEVVDVISRRRPDVVFHLAGLTSHAMVAVHPEIDAEITVVGTLRVLEGALAAGSGKVVAVVNASIYGSPDPAKLPVKETAARGPGSACTPAGIARRAVLDYLASYRDRQGLDYCALALSTVYGPHHVARPEEGAVLAFTRALLAGESGIVHGDGGQTRDFLYVDDAVDALAKAAEVGSGLLLNVATGVETSVNDLYGLVAEAVGVSLPSAGGPSRPGQPPQLALDPARAAARLGWRPWTRLEDGVAMVADRFRDVSLPAARS